VATPIVTESPPTASLLYQPDAGFYTIESGPAALLSDALASEQAHADRLVRTLGMYCETAWQRRGYSGLWDLPAPDDAPGGDDDEGGPYAEPDDRYDVTGCGCAPTDGPSERAPRFDGTRASWLARQRWAQARWKAVA
jgi:hypothetical protein